MGNRSETGGTLEPVRGVLKVLGVDRLLNYNVQLEVMRTNPVQGGKWEYRNLKEYAQTFCGTPILCAYVNGKVGDGHNFRERVDADGRKYYSFTDASAERIVGMLSEEASDIWTEERKDGEWIIARGKIWRYYNRELADKVAKQGRIEVSAETNIVEMHEEDEREIFTQWYGLGVTILGDWVPPAVPGANIRAASLRERASEFENMKLRVASLEKTETKKKEGVKSMTKTMLAALEKKFQGYRVLAASETGKYVVLLAENGEICHYTGLDADQGNIIKERIRPINLSVTFCDETAGEGAETVVLSLESITATMQETIRSLSEARDNAISERDTAQETIRTMQDRENKRRVNDAKNAVNAKLAAVNANRRGDALLSENIASGIIADIDAGRYTNCSAEDGTWNGDVLAVQALMAAVGEEQAKLDQKRVMSESGKNRFAWEDPSMDGGAGADGIEGLLSAMRTN